jgi:hypothetical protein
MFTKALISHVLPNFWVAIHSEMLSQPNKKGVTLHLTGRLSNPKVLLQQQPHSLPRYMIPEIVLSAKARPYSFVLESTVKCSLWQDTLEYQTKVGIPTTHVWFVYRSSKIKHGFLA